MSRYYSYFNSAKDILNLYKGQEPLSSFLKKYFSSKKKIGSRDRKAISHLCFCYFRLGKAAWSLTTEERLVTGIFLCSNGPNEVLKAIRPQWNEKIHLPLEEKLSIINHKVLVSEVFPWKNELSEGIEHEKFCTSFFIQPNLFLRVRPGKMEIVVKKLQSRLSAGEDLRFRIVSENCISLSNATKVDQVLDIDQEVVIQDHNSQQTGRLLNYAFTSLGDSSPSVWDCCTASGGKSILAYDIDPGIELTVSDVRESILANLKKRFQKAGIKKYRSFVIDLEKTNIQHPVLNDQQSMIIADVPCTGSGTWSRTPEQLYFFDEKKIDEYAALQKRIVSTVIPQLKSGGYFIYITCSVFKKENEEVVEFIEQNFHLKLQLKEILKGYDKKADSMFAALFKKL
jgi:16S rRNA (cytosine967-C5)-methyltransferase